MVLPPTFYLNRVMLFSFGLGSLFIFSFLSNHIEVRISIQGLCDTNPANVSVKLAHSQIEHQPFLQNFPSSFLSKVQLLSNKPNKIHRNWTEARKVFEGILSTSQCGKRYY